MRLLKPLLVVLAVSLVSTPSLAGPTPRGIDAGLWSRIVERAGKVTQAVAKVSPEADKVCVDAWIKLMLFRGVAFFDAARGKSIQVPGIAEPVEMSRYGGADSPRLIDSAVADRPDGVETYLKQLVRDSCDDRNKPGGGSRRAATDWTAANPHWDMDPQYGPALFPEGGPYQRLPEKVQTALERALPALADMVEAAGATAQGRLVPTGGLPVIIMPPRPLTGTGSAPVKSGDML